MSKAKENSVQDEDYTFFELFTLTFLKTAWRAKALFLVLPLVFAIVYGLYTAFNQYRNFVPTYLYAVELTFDGGKTGEYPNGNPFSVGDLLDTRVLEIVHEQNNLDRFGWSVVDLKDSLDVSLKGTEHFAILREFEILSKKWAKTIDQLEQVKQDTQAKLDRSASDVAQVSLMDHDFDLPRPVARSIVVDVVKAWADISVRERGVVSIQIAKIPSSALGLTKITDPNSTDALIEIDRQITAINEFVSDLSDQPGAKSALDPETGKSLVSIKRDLSSIRSALRNMPTSWSMDVSRYEGRSALPMEVFSKNIFASDLISNQDYLVALDLVEERVELLRTDIARLALEPMGARVTDPTTGFSAYEIDQLLSDIIDVDLNRLRGSLIEYGITRDEIGVKLFYETQINQLNREKDLLVQRAEVVRSALADSQNVFTSPVQQNGAPVSSGNTGVPQVSLPQLGDGFIDRLLELSQKSTSNEFLKELIEQGSELRLKEVEINGRIARLQYYISRIEEPTLIVSANGSTAAERGRELVAYVDEKLPEVMSRLQSYADAVNRIVGRLSYATELHGTLFDGVENAPPVSHYLLNASEKSLQFSDVVEQMQLINDAAIRILDILNINNLNADGQLYRPVSGVETPGYDIATLKPFLGVLLAAALGLFVALCLAGVFAIRALVPSK